MTAILIILIVYAILATGGAMFAIGLWLGEQGRRMAAERQLTFGNPGAGVRGTSRVPFKEAEDRLEEHVHDVSEQAVKALAAHLKKLAVERGVDAGVSEEQWELDARQMVAGLDISPEG